MKNNKNYKNTNNRSFRTRVNHLIKVPEVYLIDDQGESRGVVSTRDAMDIAADAGLDLVEIVPNKEPPICKILDYGKFKYQQKKKETQARKNSRTFTVKEIKFRPSINMHDYGYRLKSIKKFLEDGDKVKITFRFRGREITRKEVLKDLIKNILNDLAGISKVEQEPSSEGRQVSMVVAPISSKVVKKDENAPDNGQDQTIEPQIEQEEKPKETQVAQEEKPKEDKTE